MKLSGMFVLHSYFLFFFNFCFRQFAFFSPFFSFIFSFSCCLLHSSSSLPSTLIFLVFYPAVFVFTDSIGLGFGEVFDAENTSPDPVKDTTVLLLNTIAPGEGRFLGVDVFIEAAGCMSMQVLMSSFNQSVNQPQTSQPIS